MKTPYGKRALRALLGISFFCLVFAGCAIFHQKTQAEKEARIILETLQFIEKYSLTPVNLTECRYILLKRLKPSQGYMGNQGAHSCLDEFSGYFTPDEAKKINIENVGHFSGIGVEFEWKDGELVITDVREHSPAEKAKILRGDKVIAVRQDSEKEDFLVKGAYVGKVAGKIKGLNGTTVFLTIQRGETILPVFALQRADIKIETVKAKEISKEILYIRLSRFNRESAADIYDKIDAFQKKNHTCRKVIFDLRDNLGGLFFAAQEILYDVAKNNDDIIVTTRYRSTKDTIRVRDGKGTFFFQDSKIVKGPGTFRDCKLAVLINHESASSSEIVAGTLQDWGRAVIVGEASFKKGVGQGHYMLSDGSMLKLTAFEFLVGNGKRSIHNIGVKPDIEVIWAQRAGQMQDAFQKEYTENFGNPLKDPQLMKAIEIVSQ